MAIENALGSAGYLKAGEDLSSTSGLTGQGTSGQFLAVKLSTAADFTVLHCSTGNERMRGVLQNKPKSGEVANVMQEGTSKVVLAGTVTRGDLAEITSAGSFVTATSGHKAVGEFEESGVTGDIRSMRIYDGWVLAP